ncbi:MAG: metallophosphoesterase family protein [Thermosynechococcus sp.]
MVVRLGIISDPHIALPETIPPHDPPIFLYEVSIPAFEAAVSHLLDLGIDALLIPGDLTRDGEVLNHRWLSTYLQTLAVPCYAIPGNHDVPLPLGDNNRIGWADFPQWYAHAGYGKGAKHYYHTLLADNLQLIALNSNQFSPTGQQVGAVDQEQLAWLAALLAEPFAGLRLVMIHHNLLEHWPQQSQSPMGQRYLLENRAELLNLLRSAGVALVLTGHLHVQDIAYEQGLFDLTTGSLVSYPHPYRRLILQERSSGGWRVDVESYRIESLKAYPTLSDLSRSWMVQRGAGFMVRFLTLPPFNLPETEAKPLAQTLSFLWPEIAKGDTQVTLPDLPPSLAAYFAQFNHRPPTEYPHLGDNNTAFVI